jgi:hypothetical protein
VGLDGELTGTSDEIVHVRPSACLDPPGQPHGGTGKNRVRRSWPVCAALATSVTPMYQVKQVI